MRQAAADVSWWIGFVSSLQMRQATADGSCWIGLVGSLQMIQATADVSCWIGFVSSLQMILSLLVKLPIGILMWYYHDTFLSFYYCPPPINRTSGSFACCSQIQNVCRELLKRGENSNPFRTCPQASRWNSKTKGCMCIISYKKITRNLEVL